MIVEINGHQVELDDNFANLSEDEQHRQIDEIAGSLPNAQPAVDKPAPEHEASAMPNVLAGGEAALLSMGVGVPKAALHAAKSYFGSPPTANIPEPSNIPGEERWFGSANKINEKAKIIRRNNELAKRYPGFERTVPPETPVSLPKQVAGGLEKLRTTTPGKAFVSGYNAMDVGKHAGEGPLGNVQAGLSATATVAPWAEKYLPGKYKKIAKIGALATPAVNYAIDKLSESSPDQKATGGLVQGFAKGKLVEGAGSEIMKILESKMAPLYVKGAGIPERLPRANPKTDAEIRAFAERMAPQVRGDFVQAPGKTTSVAGKTRAQFEREQGLQHDIRDVYPLGTPPVYNEAAHQGKVKVGIAGDQTLTGKDVHAIAGNVLSDPSRQYGGALYGQKLKHLQPHNPQSWASEPEAASGVQNLVNTAAEQYGDTGVLGQYMKMGPVANNYAMHNADAIIKSIDPSKINKLDELNQIIGAKFPGFAGLHDRKGVMEQAQENPELRKFLDYLVQTRKHVDEYNLPNGQDIRHALSEPDLRNLEIGATGKSISEMVPGGSLSPSSSKTTTTYSQNIPGEFIGSTQYPRPHEFEFADSHLALQNKIQNVQDLAKQAVAENPDMDPQAALNYAKKYGHQGFGGFRLSQPRQIMDQQYMDEMAKYDDYMKKLVGFKKGGSV